MRYRVTQATNPSWGGSGHEGSTGHKVCKNYNEGLDALEERVKHNYEMEDGVSRFRDDASEEYGKALAAISAARSDPSKPELRLTVGSDIHILRED